MFCSLFVEKISWATEWSKEDQVSLPHRHMLQPLHEFECHLTSDVLSTMTQRSDLVATVAEEDRVVSQTLERTHVAITMKIVGQIKLRSWR